MTMAAGELGGGSLLEVVFLAPVHLVKQPNKH